MSWSWLVSMLTVLANDNFISHHSIGAVSQSISATVFKNVTSVDPAIKSAKVLASKSTYSTKSNSTYYTVKWSMPVVYSVFSWILLVCSGYHFPVVVV